MLYGSTANPFLAEATDYMILFHAITGAVMIGWSLSLFAALEQHTNAWRMIKRTEICYHLSQ